MVIPSLDVRIEAKNHARVNLINWWEQAKKQVFSDNIPVLAIRNPQKPEFEEVLMVMDLGDWIDMALGVVGEAEVIGNPDKELLWSLRDLKNSIQKVVKKLQKYE